MRKERWCPSGQHFAGESAFRIVAGKFARNCRACEAKKTPPSMPDSREVDIDRIHYQLGAIAPFGAKPFPGRKAKA